MRKIIITDASLKQTASNEAVMSYKEKVEIAKTLDKLNVSTISLSEIVNDKIDTLMVRTIASVVLNSTISIPVGFTTETVDTAWNAISKAAHPELSVEIPTSPVQMEYVLHKKAPQAVELVKELVEKAKSYCENVNFSAIDATRSEFDFLCDSIKVAIESGATSVTICDNAGNMMPDEFSDFVCKIISNVNADKEVDFIVQCNDKNAMAVACAISAIRSGANGVVVVLNGTVAPSLQDISNIISNIGTNYDIATDLKNTELKYSVGKISWISKVKHTIENQMKDENNQMVFDKNDDISVINEAVTKLGYDLSDEDVKKVFDAFSRVADKKTVSSKELEAIIATTALQVPDTYHLVNFVINSGNQINSTSCVTFQKDGKDVEGFSTGDGPIDASFRAIEQIVGRHYELDDFQIQSITEGREAVGSALVKLRANGKLFSGNGVSTDIIGASIRAYVNALNKIAYEENQ